MDTICDNMLSSAKASYLEALNVIIVIIHVLNIKLVLSLHMDCTLMLLL